jgi:hypothetical protein
VELLNLAAIDFRLPCFARPTGHHALFAERSVAARIEWRGTRDVNARSKS